MPKRSLAVPSQPKTSQIISESKDVIPEEEINVEDDSELARDLDEERDNVSEMQAVE